MERCECVVVKAAGGAENTWNIQENNLRTSKDVGVGTVRNCQYPIASNVKI